jgi:hypothetical protein
MKQTKFISLISVAIITGLLTLLIVVNHSYCETQKLKSNNAADQTKPAKPKEQPEKIQDYPAVEKKAERKPAPFVTPIYKPPLRGAPVGRVAGGTRGILAENVLLLCVLTPDHTALTTQDQPSLYYFLGQKSQYPIELTIIEDQGIYPILEKQIASPEAPGIQAIHMRDYDLHLEKDKVYKWFITIIPDPVRRSKDILAWGAIKRIDIPESVRHKIAGSGKEQIAQIYANAGIWYDSFAEISKLIESYPSNQEFRQQRSDLLEQVGLKEIDQLI